MNTCPFIFIQDKHTFTLDNIIIIFGEREGMEMQCVCVCVLYDCMCQIYWLYGIVHVFSNMNASLRKIQITAVQCLCTAVHIVHFGCESNWIE